MKKVVFLVVVLCLQSCFYIHRAPEIPTYKIVENQENQDALNTYIFEYNGSFAQKTRLIEDFFVLTETQNPYYFTTTSLVEGKELRVDISPVNDYDKHFNLLEGILDAKENRDSKTHEQKRRKAIQDAKDDKRKERQNKHQYLYIRVMGENGEDLLKGKSLEKRMVLLRLHEFRKIFSH